jgi:hypothetical protein
VIHGSYYGPFTIYNDSEAFFFSLSPFRKLSKQCVTSVLKDTEYHYHNDEEDYPSDYEEESYFLEGAQRSSKLRM